MIIMVLTDIVDTNCLSLFAVTFRPTPTLRESQAEINVSTKTIIIKMYHKTHLSHCICFMQIFRDCLVIINFKII